MAELERADRIDLFQRKDGKWGWRRMAHENGQVIATDGGQGYENEEDCYHGAVRSQTPAWVAPWKREEATHDDGPSVQPEPAPVRGVEAVPQDGGDAGAED